MAGGADDEEHWSELWFGLVWLEMFSAQEAPGGPHGRPFLVQPG
jgi:hypothetical protein